MDYTTTFTDKTRQVFVVTGDGLRDEMLLRELALKFNGVHKSLAITTLPFGRKTGKSALEGLSRVLHMGVTMNNALFVVDREHFQDSSDVAKNLPEHGFNIVESTEIVAGRAAIFTLDHGRKRLKLFVAIAGRTSIDEEIAKLASAVYKENITSERAKQLRSREVKELISKAPRSLLKDKMPGIASTLEVIERDDP